MESSDPTVVRSIAVTVEDLVAAVEMNRTSDKHAVLRVTPPFSGRMRARLHVEGSEEYDGEPTPLHVEPETLLDDPPSYPRPAETEDELREDPAETYTVERHHDRHRAAVQEWRETIPNRISDRIRLATPDGDCDVSVTVLGSDDELDGAF
jgi:hypothetical protein